MKLCKLLKYDMKQGFAKAWIRLLFICAIVIVSCLEMDVEWRGQFYFEDIVPQKTFMDYAFFLFGGIKRYLATPHENFLFPVKWLLLHIAIMYGTLHFSYRDIESLGGSILSKSGRRTGWWLSKCIWNITYIINSYLMIGVVVALYCLIRGGTFSVYINPRLVNDIMESTGNYKEFPVELCALTFILPLLVSVTSSLLQMMLTLFVKPMFSFGILTMVFAISAYLYFEVVYGSYSMLIRSKYVIEGGFEPLTGIITNLVLIVIILLVGMIRFKKYDILSRE